ncbi:LysR family transcriptional regulator [Streptomyces sp. NPDC057702]|uniref:LysR family transcriptional regulator n=1 Tax=unclassified Streptomyces TaxID=2593676 RepID=UPI0036B18D96
MEHRDIEIFLTLAQELHFGRTAERLHVSPARISQAISKTERRIGARLFDRTSRLVSLTPIGSQLRDDLQPAYEQIQAAVARAVESGRGVGEVLRVGFIGAGVGMFVYEVAEIFRARHPAGEVRALEQRYVDAGTLLAGGEIDLLLCVAPPVRPEVSESPILFSEEPVLAVSARHPLARRATVRLDDLARAAVLRPRLIAPEVDAMAVPATTPAGHPVERGPDFGTIQEMLALVGAGRGVYPVPAHARRFDSRPDVAYVPIEDAPPFAWRLLWRTSAATSQFHAFVQAARDAVATRANPLLEPAPEGTARGA